MCNLLPHFSHYSIALNLIFTTHMFSPTFPNFLCSLPQIESIPSQVRHHYLQKNQEAHLERALKFKKAASPHCPSNICLPMLCLHVLYCRWLMSPISWLRQDDNTNLEIHNNEGKGTGESPLSSDIEEDNLDYQQVDLLLGKACRNKSLQTTRVPLPKQQSHADTVIAHSLLPSFRNPAGAMAPPLPKCQM